MVNKLFHVFSYEWDQISGANVTVFDPCVGERGGKVVISGTPDQTLAAQSLLQAFIQAGERTAAS